MGRLLAVAFVALFALMLLPPPTSAGGACENAPPGIHNNGEGPQVGRERISGMTLMVPPTAASEDVKYVVFDLVNSELQIWTETNTLPGLQRDVWCHPGWSADGWWPDTPFQTSL